MKYFLILFTFLISLNAFADREIGFDVTTMKSQSSKPASPKVGHGKVFLKNGKLVSIDSNGKETQYGINGNLVKNSSFESFTALEDWSVSTITPTRTTNSRVTGEYGIEFTASAAQQGLFQYVDIPPSLVGELLEYSFYVQSNEDVEVCSLNDSIVSVCKTYYGNSSQGMRKVIVTDRPKNTNASANGVLLRTKTANLSNVKADDAHIGLPKSDEAIVAKFDNTSNKVPCTFSTLSWVGFGTVTTNNITCRRDRYHLVLEGNFVATGVTGSIVEIPMPTNYGTITIADTTSTNLLVGSYIKGVTSTEHGGGVAVNTTIKNNVIYFTDGGVFGGPSTNGTDRAIGTRVGGTISFVGEIKIPIAEWSAQTNAAIVGCRESDKRKCVNQIYFKRSSPDLFAVDQFGNSYPVTKGANTGYSIVNLTSLGLTNEMYCTPVISGGANFFGWTTILNPSSNTQTTVYTVNAQGTAAVDAGFYIGCMKTGSDYNEAYEKIVIQKDNADIRSTEWLTGGFNYIDNKPIYKRCHKVVSDVTTASTLTNFGASLRPVSAYNFHTTLYQISGVWLNSGGSRVLYDSSNGNLLFQVTEASGKIGSGSVVCMEYTR